MKQKFYPILKIVVIVLAVEVIFLGIYYLFVHDKSEKFTPQLGSPFLINRIEQIQPLTEDMSGEITIKQDGVRGILVYHCSTNTPGEMSESLQHLNDRWDYTHIVFPDDSYEIYVNDVHYTDIINAWQYGWWDRQGNEYARWYGEEAAEDKPNYRYFYRLVIRKNNDLHYWDVFCNTDDAQKVFSLCVENINSLE